MTTRTLWIKRIAAAGLDELALTDDQCDTIVAAAGEMFDGLSAISEELSETSVV